MSEQKTIKLKFEGQEKIVPIFKLFKECVKGFQKSFSIDDEKAKKLNLFYYDCDGDKIAFQSDTDYKLFIDDESEKEKTVEGEIAEDKEVSISLQSNDPIKIGDKKGHDGELNIKHLDSSSFLGNSLYSIENLNNDMDFQKKNNKEFDEINKEINQMNLMINKALEENNKESLIQEMKKKMDEMIKNHKEELKKKEEENQKYKLSLIQKDEELKKKLEEEKLRMEKEITEKYENEMKSSMLQKEKELEEMKSKIETENLEKMEEMKQETLKKFNRLKSIDEEKIKKIEQEKQRLEEEKKKLENDNKIKMEEIIKKKDLELRQKIEELKKNQEIDIQEYKKKEEEALKKSEEFLKKLEQEKKEKEEVNKRLHKIEEEKKAKGEKVKKEVKKPKVEKGKKKDPKKDKEKKEKEIKGSEEKQNEEKEKKEAEERNKRIQEKIKKKALQDLNSQKKKKNINLNEEEKIEMNIETLNQESQKFKNKLKAMKNQCYKEMNENYKNILQAKINEINKSISNDVKKQNQQFIDNYVKKIKELEQKREHDYHQMSKIIINDNPKKEEDEESISISMVKTTHTGIKCKNCGVFPIIGYRYKCSVCKCYNLCEACEELNSRTGKHKHNFIQMRKSDENDDSEFYESFVDPNFKKEYKYEILNNDLCKEATEFQDNEVTFHIELKNTGNAQWSEIGKTKLINDKKSEIKANDVNLYNLKVGEEQIVTITLNISNARAGEKKSIFHLNIDGENIGEPLILTVNIKEDEQVTKMREEYWLSKEDHDSKKILKALRESNNDSKKAFDSLFSHN